MLCHIRGVGLRLMWGLLRSLCVIEMRQRDRQRRRRQNGWFEWCLHFALADVWVMCACLCRRVLRWLCEGTALELSLTLTFLIWLESMTTSSALEWFSTTSRYLMKMWWERWLWWWLWCSSWLWWWWWWWWWWLSWWWLWCSSWLWCCSLILHDSFCV